MLINMRISDADAQVLIESVTARIQALTVERSSDVFGKAHEAIDRQIRRHALMLIDLTNAVDQRRIAERKEKEAQQAA